MRVTPLAILIPVLLVGCATARPVIYPTAAAQASGQQGQQASVAECLRQADAANLDRDGAVVGSSTARGAIMGGAAGAGAGAVYGDLGRHAGAGAAAGAATGLVSGLFRARQPSPVYQAYVNRCLADKGFDVVGWQ